VKSITDKVVENLGQEGLWYMYGMINLWTWESERGTWFKPI